jgi:hypothetical protein
MTVRVVWACALLGCGRIGFVPGDSRIGDGVGAEDMAAPSCPAGALLCDDFESGTTAKWTRSASAQGGTATITSANPHSGALSLEVDCAAQAMNDCQGALELDFSPQTTGVLAVREWLNTTTTMQHFDLVAQVETLAPFQYSSAGGNDFGMWVSTELGPPGNMGPDHTSATSTPAPGTWTCLELVYTFSGAAGAARIQMFVDEASVLDMPANDTNSATYNNVAVGISRADKAGFHVFVDDVVIANARIHCN